MRKPTILLFCGATLFLFTTCRKALKNVEDYYPEVQTTAAVTTEGFVEVTGEIIKDGHSDIVYAGFCMDTVPLPDMLKNQKLSGELVDGKFKVVYDGNFNPAKTYYFRSFATNDAGYSYGNAVGISNIRSIPVTAPCTLNANSSNIGLNGTGPGQANSVYDVTEVDHFSSTWDITARGYNAQAGTLDLEFGSDLRTKIYTTTRNEPYGDQVRIFVSSGFSDGVVNDGFKVYVNQLDPKKYEITICDAGWTIDGTTYSTKLNARFISPL